MANNKDLKEEEKLWSNLPQDLISMILARHSGKTSISRCGSIISSNKYLDKEDEVEISWSHLPPDLLHLILAHLSNKDSIRFRSVCRSWRSIPAIVPPLSPPFDSLLSGPPCLITLHKDNTCSFTNAERYASYSMYTPSLSGAKFCFSNNGWLLMYCDGDGESVGNLFFYNPATKLIIRIPDIPITTVRSGDRDIAAKREFTAMNFSSRPTCLDCVIIGMSSISNIWIRIGVIKYGEENWTLYLYKADPLFYIYSTYLVLHKGLYYCLGSCGNVGIFDPGNDEQEPNWSICTARLPNITERPEAFMVENDGQLFAVYVSLFERRIDLLKLDENKMIWEEVKELKDRDLYLSPSSFYSEKFYSKKARVGRIYFPEYSARSFELGYITNYSVRCYTWIKS